MDFMLICIIVNFQRKKLHKMKINARDIDCFVRFIFFNYRFFTILLKLYEKARILTFFFIKIYLSLERNGNHR